MVGAWGRRLSALFVGARDGCCAARPQLARHLFLLLAPLVVSVRKSVSICPLENKSHFQRRRGTYRIVFKGSSFSSWCFCVSAISCCIHANANREYDKSPAPPLPTPPPSRVRVSPSDVFFFINFLPTSSPRYLLRDRRGASVSHFVGQRVRALSQVLQPGHPTLLRNYTRYSSYRVEPENECQDAWRLV